MTMIDDDQEKNKIVLMLIIFIGQRNGRFCREGKKIKGKN